MKLEKSLSETGLNSTEGFRDFPQWDLTARACPGKPNGFLEGDFFSQNPPGLTLQAVGSDSVIFKGERVT